MKINENGYIEPEIGDLVKFRNKEIQLVTVEEIVKNASLKNAIALQLHVWTKKEVTENRLYLKKWEMTKEDFKEIRLLNHCSNREVHLESGAPEGGIRTFRMGKNNMALLEKWCHENFNPIQIDWEFLESIRNDKPMNYMDHIIGLNYGTYGSYMKGIKPFRANYLKIIAFQNRRKTCYTTCRFM